MRQSAEQIETEAARWVLRIDREGRTAALQAELEGWLTVDSRRRGALLQAEAAWLLAGPDQGLDLPRVPTATRVRSLPRRALLTGAGAALAAGVGTLMIMNRTGRYDTALGEIRRVPLADGSTAALNTTTAIDVDMQPRLRRVRVGKGEAWFQVAKDSARPFLVEAGAVRVQALGTAFSVRRLDDGVDVAVTEGVVKVWTVGAEDRAVRLTAGSRSLVADDAEVFALHTAPSDIDRQLAWRGGKIDLAGETLEQAVAEFNRYNVRKLVVVDPALAGERLFGIFRTDDPEGFAKAVETSLSASVSLTDPAEIRISRAPD